MGISRLQKEWLNTKGTVKAHVLLFKLNLLRATPKEWLVFENVHLLQSKNNIQTPNIKYPDYIYNNSAFLLNSFYMKFLK